MIPGMGSFRWGSLGPPQTWDGRQAVAKKDKFINHALVRSLIGAFHNFSHCLNRDLSKLSVFITDPERHGMPVMRLSALMGWYGYLTASYSLFHRSTEQILRHESKSGTNEQRDMIARLREAPHARTATSPARHSLKDDAHRVRYRSSTESLTEKLSPGSKEACEPHKAQGAERSTDKCMRNRSTIDQPLPSPE